MKRGIYFPIIVLLLICKQIQGQTIPFGFKNPKVHLLQDVPKSVTSKTFTDTHGIEKKTNDTLTIFKKISIELKNTETQIKQTAELDFANQLDKLKNPSTIEGYREFEVKLDILEKERKSKLKTATFFLKKSKAFEYLDRTSGKFKLFPVKSAVDAEMYYNGSISDNRIKFLSNTLLSFSSDGGRASLFNELYADYWGPVRVGLGALISNRQANKDPESVESKNEKSKDAMQRLLGGGGNGIINASYPLLNIDNGDGFSMKLSAVPKLGIDIPKIGTDNSDYALNYNLGTEGIIFYTGALDILTFYSNFRFAKMGGNTAFYNNLEKEKHKSFGFNQITFGLAISSTFRLGYNHYFGSEFVNKNFPGTISFTIIPN